MLISKAPEQPWRNHVVIGRTEDGDYVTYDPITVARFWSKVEVTKSDTECWTWKGATKTLGYGRIKVRGQSLTASRVAWELFTGLNLGQRFALHRCDNPACCNPLHIYPGDADRNARDAAHEAAKGKIAERMSMKGRKLTRYQAAQVKAALACGMSDDVVASWAGISARSVADIRRGATFADAPTREDMIEEFRRQLGAKARPAALASHGGQS